MHTVTFRVTVPDELLQELLQAVRDFDIKHDPRHEGRVEFELLTESDWPIEKMEKVMRAVRPVPEFFNIKPHEAE